MIGDARHHIRSQQEIDEIMRRFLIGRISRDCQHVKPKLRALARCGIANFNTTPSFLCARLRLDDIAGIG